MSSEIDYAESSGRTSFLFYVWLVILVAALLPLGYYVSQYLLNEEPILSEYVSSSVTWGLLVPVYVFFVLTGSGLCLISSLGHIFKIGAFELISRRAVFTAIVMMLSGFLAIALDLGRLDRAYIPFLVQQNFSSPMMLMMTLYLVYFLAIILEFWLLSRFGIALKAQSSSGLKSIFYTLLTLGRRSTSDESEETDHRIARFVGVGALFLAVAAPTNLGGIFGAIKAHPFFLGAYAPLFFIVTALVSGTAILLFTTIVSYRVSGREIDLHMQDVLINLGKILGFLIVVLGVFIIWKVLTDIFSSVTQQIEAQMLLLTGPLSLQFLGLEIILGAIIPFILLIHPKTRQNISSILAASIFVIIGIFFTRYDFIIAGQVIPNLEPAHGFFFPSQVELTILMSLIALAGLVFTVGQRIFPLDEH